MPFKDSLISLAVVESLFGSKVLEVRNHRINLDGSREAWLTDVARDLKVPVARLAIQLRRIELERLAK